MLPLETGFEAPGIAVIGEQDILGDRLVRRTRAKRSPMCSPRSPSLTVGDLVVHADHGIGRFVGLTTIEAAGEPHDCLELHYQGGDKLYLPVENIELLSRYGSDESGVQLDRLGGVAWQSRKARLKKRIRDIAEKLIKVAAMRELRQAPVITPPDGLYDEFSARFPYEETEDQATSINAVLDDLASGRPMDRLICGDVGFGKTEVALRASLLAVLAGKQVAVVVPTTLLARQHYRTFIERFRGLPVKIAQASRLVSGKELAEAKKALKDGSIDIVIGTHALLGKAIEFTDLGLLDHRRGAAFRRAAQGAAEAAPRGRACADADRDAHSAHAAAGALRRARDVAHRHAAGRPAGGAHLRHAVRPRHYCARRCCASGIAAARASSSCRASPICRGSGLPRGACAGAEGRARARADGRRASSIK